VSVVSQDHAERIRLRIVGDFHPALCLQYLAIRLVR